MIGFRFPSLLADPFSDHIDEDPFSFARRGSRFPGMMMLGNGDGMSLIPGGHMTMMSSMNTGRMGGSSMMMVSSSFSSTNGGEIHMSSTTARIGPGGVTEVQRQVRDGRTGEEKIVLERRLGDQARRVEKVRNARTGVEETVDNTYGIQDGMEDHFDREWHQAARTQLGSAPQPHLFGVETQLSGPNHASSVGSCPSKLMTRRSLAPAPSQRSEAPPAATAQQYPPQCTQQYMQQFSAQYPPHPQFQHTYVTPEYTRPGGNYPGYDARHQPPQTFGPGGGRWA